MTLSAQQAFASAGCSQLSGSDTDGSLSGSFFATGFSAGDTITFTVISGSVNIGLYDNTTSATLVAAGHVSFTYTVPATTSDTLILAGSYGNPSSATWSCAAAGSGSSTSTDSQKLQSLVNLGTHVIANVSGQVVTNEVEGAIDDAFSDGGAFFTGGSSGFHLNFAGEQAAQQTPPDPRFDEARALFDHAGGMPTKAPPAAMPVWLPWVDVRGTGFDRDDAAVGIQDRQVNASAGVGRLLSSNLLVGVFTGYENFHLTVASLTGTMNGNGGTLGSYAAWRFAPNWRADGIFGFTGLDDRASAGTASGSFNASRWLASGGLTGNYRTGLFLFEPSSNVYALWERDDGFGDTLGTLQPQNKFSAGRVATGGKLSDPLPWSGSFTVSPYVGFYGDWYWSTSTAIAGGTPLVGFSNGWSGRVTGGVNVARAAGATVSLGGEYGGLGAAYKVWTASGRVEWPF